MSCLLQRIVVILLVWWTEVSNANDSNHSQDYQVYRRTRQDAKRKARNVDTGNNRRLRGSTTPGPSDQSPSSLFIRSNKCGNADDSNANSEDCSGSKVWTYEVQIELLPFHLNLSADVIFDKLTLQSLTEKFILNEFKRVNETSHSIDRLELHDNKNQQEQPGEDSSVGNYKGVVCFRGVDNVPTPEEVEIVQINALQNHDKSNEVLESYLESTKNQNIK